MLQQRLDVKAKERTMNYKAIIAIVMVLAIMSPVMAVTYQYDQQTGVNSKYNPDVGTAATTFGIVYGNLKSGQVLEGGEKFTVSNGNVTKKYSFTADGLFSGEFPPGTYTVTLPQGTGSAAGLGGVGNLHPEMAQITVVAGQVSYFTFIGNSISAAVEEEQAPIYTVISAEYGMTQVVIDQAYVPGIPAVPGIPEHYVYVGVGNGDYAKFFGHYYYAGNNHGSYDKIAAVPAIPAIPAIPEVSHVEGTFADVTANVQSAINQGVMTIKFDNTQNPGGIFNMNNDLVSQIDDPAYGQVKTVTIQYTVDGVVKNINAMEYETISI